jgi:hypothetical protein
MLSTLDILIGFTVVMLIISMPVTMLTQAMISFFNLRGAALHHGVVGLLGLLDPRLKATAGVNADRILGNPLVAKRTLLGSLPWIGSLMNDHWLALDRAGTIHREELAKLILGLAIGPDTEKLLQNRNDAKAALDGARAELAKINASAAEYADLKAKVDAANDKFESATRAYRDAETAGGAEFRAAIVDLGIAEPETVLKLVRTAQLALERDKPELAANVRASMALIENASSDFLAKFNAWFDQSMDRVSDVFVQYSRAVTFVMALIVALFLQLDSIGLVNRLAADPKTRTALVESAVQNPERFNPDPDAKTARDDAKTVADSAAATLNSIDATKAHDAAKGKDCRGVDKADMVCIVDAAARLAEAKSTEAVNRYLAADAHYAAVEAARKVAAARAMRDDPATVDHAKAKAEYDRVVTEAAKAKATDDTLAAKALTPDALVKKFEEDPDLADLVNLKLIELPRDGHDWWARFVAMLHHPGQAFGILLTAALLSLGAPFWYALLQNLIKLRPEIARKDDAQRAARQTKDPDPAAAKPK